MAGAFLWADEAAACESLSGQVQSSTLFKICGLPPTNPTRVQCPKSIRGIDYNEVPKSLAILGSAKLLKSP